MPEVEKRIQEDTDPKEASRHQKGCKTIYNKGEMKCFFSSPSNAINHNDIRMHALFIQIVDKGATLSREYSWDWASMPPLVVVAGAVPVLFRKGTKRTCLFSCA